MKSIRRTLILNVTVLLVLALGTMAALVYRITRDALEEKHRSASELVKMQFEDQRDEALRNQRRELESVAEHGFDPVKFRQIGAALSVGLTLGPNSHISAPLWLVERPPVRSFPNRFSLSNHLNLMLATEAKLSELEELKYGYVQIDNEWGTIWRSKPLADQTLPLDPAKFDSEKRLENYEVTPGVIARLVHFKTSLTRTPVMFEPSPEIKASLGVASGLRRDRFNPDRITGTPVDLRRRIPGTPPGPGGGQPRLFQQPIYIQIAWDSTNCPPRMHEFEAARDQKIDELDLENRQVLAHLKERLLWMSCATVAIVIVGGWLLVGVGLSPLKRLSHAVSQVSAKDFRLPIDPKKQPREVAPVVERLQQTLQQLQEAFAREKRASADISHELRTPLAALTTTLEVALRKPRSPEDYRQTIEDSRQIARQISSLVERMLTLAWLDAGADVFRSQAVDVDQLVDGCAAIGKPLAEAQGLRFQVKAERPLTVQTDPDKLREVVMNLVHNAIEYNQPGGEVEISAQTAAAGGIVLEVRDTGIGIPSELHQKIFERFYRGDPSRNAAGVHAGLGLAIVKEYVDRLGGRLSIESTVGAGSRFRVELPHG